MLVIYNSEENTLGDLNFSDICNDIDDLRENLGKPIKSATKLLIDFLCWIIVGFLPLSLLRCLPYRIVRENLYDDKAKKNFLYCLVRYFAYSFYFEQKESHSGRLLYVTLFFHLVKEIRNGSFYSALNDISLLQFILRETEKEEESDSSCSYLKFLSLRKMLSSTDKIEEIRPLLN